MTGSVYERVLGPDIELLAPELRNYFTGKTVGTGHGVFTEAGLRLRFLWPVLAFMAWQRILFPEYGRDVSFTVVNTPTANGSLDAVRTFHFPGMDRPLEDTMRVVDGRLHDFMGRNRGFEVRMALTIAGGSVHMRSDGQWLRFLRARIPVPQLATVCVTDSWADGSQHVDVRLRSPILGEWFRYAGRFTYDYP
jgi:hypothetical protein